jgi:hypothetical protein
MAEHDPAPERRRAERRAYVRLASDLAASCRPTGRVLEPSWLGTVRDISRGGVGLLMRHCFHPGTPLAVELRAGTGRLLRTVQARVIHATALIVDGSHCWLLGCAFESPLTEEELHALR